MNEPAMTPNGRLLFRLYDKQEAAIAEAEQIKHRLEVEGMFGWKRRRLAKRYKRLCSNVVFYERAIEAVRTKEGLDGSISHS